MVVRYGIACPVADLSAYKLSGALRSPPVALFSDMTPVKVICARRLAAAHRLRFAHSAAIDE
jgi:hypothetical protein